MSLLEETAKLSHNAKETSRLAALKMAPKAGTLREMVLRCIVVAGNYGRTDDAIVTNLGKSPNSIRPRRVELVEGGFIIDSGRKRASEYGNDAIVWVATEKGIAACQ